MRGQDIYSRKVDGRAKRSSSRHRDDPKSVDITDAAMLLTLFGISGLGAVCGLQSGNPAFATLAGMVFLLASCPIVAFAGRRLGVLADMERLLSKIWPSTQTTHDR
jgi:hypothetical protein